MSEAGPVELARPVRLAFAAALLIDLSIAGWLVWRTSILEAFSDMFDWMERWYALQADGDLGRYLWAPHNFHHLVWTFAVLALDVRVFGASGYLFLAVGVLCLMVTAAMLAGLGAAAAGRGLKLVGGGGAAALSAMGCHALDASADINTTYVHALMFAVAAILLAEAPGRQARWRPLAALACAAAAGLGSAAGLAVWPALLFRAWRTGRRGWAAAVLASGAAFSLCYLLGQAPPGSAGSASATAVVTMIVNDLGLPWARGLGGAGWLVGLVVLVAALTALHFKGGAGAAWPERAAASLIVFSLTTASLAGVARAGVIAPGLPPMRYAIFMIPLHVGLWVLALPYLRRAWTWRPRLMERAVVAAAVLMVAHQAVTAVYAVRTADAALGEIADFRAGQRKPAMFIAIYPDLAKAQALSRRMRRDGFYQRELRADPAPSGSGTWVSRTDR